jgi:hypothetical protein
MSRTAVCIHGYYPAVFTNIIDKIRHIATECDVFVSTIEEHVDLFREIVRRAGIKSCHLTAYENSGMDVLPFLKTVRDNGLSSYDNIIKLHTKNAIGRGVIHQSIMLDSVVGDQDVFSRLRTIFDHERSVLMAGHEILFKPSDTFVYGNARAIAEIQKLVVGEPRPLRHGFFAGTTFWTRGSVVARLAEEIDALEALQGAILGRSDRTGDDGQLAHALERIWLELDPVPQCRVALVRPRLHGEGFDVRIAPADQAAHEAGRTIATTQVLLRAPHFRRDFRAIRSSRLFDETHYVAAYSAQLPRDLAALHHFIFYGEILGLNPSDKFHTGFYRLMYNDLRMEHNSLSHYLRKGRWEKRIVAPGSSDWLALARQLKLYCPSWYRERYPDSPRDERDVHEHLLACAMHWGRKASPNFDPWSAAVLNVPRRFGEAPFLIEYLERHAIDEIEASKCVISMAENGDYAGAERQATAIAERYGPSGALWAVLALCRLKRQAWDAALGLARDHWAHNAAGALPERHFPSLIRDKRTGNAIFEAVAARSGRRARVCVYTAIYGGYDTLPPVLSETSGIDFICFSDRALEAHGWQVRIRPSPYNDPNLAAKYFKLFPHKVLGEYDYSIFVDGHTLFVGRIGKLIDTYLLGERFVMWRHPERSDVYRELIAIVELKKHEPDAIFAQVRRYAEAGLPENSGLAEASFIWRAHDDPPLQAFMEAWWREILTHSKRDQLSLGYLMWQQDFRPRVLPDALGTSRDNPYFRKLLPHRRPPAPTQAPARAPLTFLYANAFRATGSTVMRGRQLSLLAREACPERCVDYSAEDHWFGRILFLTKGFLRKSTPEQLARLKDRRNVLLADFVDARPEIAKMPYVDALVAASLKAVIDYRRRWPDKAVFHVTHHVDPRIVPGNSAGAFSAGYIGESVNAIWTERLRDEVACLQVDTDQSTDRWLGETHRFNLHYAVRHARSNDGFKPFLKGFVAARCQANIIIQRNSGDALYYLGPDYPFLLGAKPTEDDILAMIDHARGSFGGPLWQDGLSTMREIEHRSCDAYVRGEIASMMRQL